MRYFFSLIQKIIERACKKANGLKVYMFHQVDDNQKKWRDKGVSITTDGFIQFIEGLISSNHCFISVNEISVENAISGNVIITFDDIFQDAMDNAFPFLVEKGIPFCVFISESFIDTENYISRESLDRLLAEPLCTIAYHSRNHRKLRFQKHSIVLQEIDCINFKKDIKREISFFAFPYGSLYACDIRSIFSVRGKYKFAFSTIAMPCTKWQIRRIPFFLPRINVCEDNYKEL